MQDRETTNGAAGLTADLDLDAPPTRTDLHDPRQRGQVEAEIAAVPGVLSARLVPGFERPVDELHVLTSLDKAPKQAVRDVQTVLMARFGVSTDHRVISVVPLDERDRLGDTARLIIEAVGLTQSRATVTAQVHLRDRDDHLHGTSEGASTPTGRHRATAQATIDALTERLGEHDHVELEAAGVTDLHGWRLALSVLALRTGRHSQELSGCALVRDGEPDAVARSVLDALNRTLAEASER